MRVLIMTAKDRSAKHQSQLTFALLTSIGKCDESH